MKNLNIKNLRSRLVLAGILLVAMLFFTNDFTLVDVEKTAIIVAVGVDKEQDKFEVSCQIATPNSQATTQSEQQVVVSGTGDTISKAINNIHSRTGWYPKLNFCNLIILGDSVIKEDAIMPLNYFFRSESFNDSAMIVSTPKTALELLQKNTPLDDLSSYAIQKIIDKANTKISDVVSVNLKDVMKTYYSKSNTIIMPYVNLVPLKKESQGQKTMAAGAGEQKEEFIYEATKSVIIKNNKNIGEIDERMTRIYTLITDKRTKAYYSIEKTADHEAIEIAIAEKSMKQEYEIENNHPVYTVKLKIKARIVDSAKSDSEIGDLSNNLYIDAATRDIIEKNIYTDVGKLFDICKQKNADFLKIGSSLYKYKTNEYKRLMNTLPNQEDYMSNAAININIKVESM